MSGRNDAFEKKNRLLEHLIHNKSKARQSEKREPCSGPVLCFEWLTLPGNSKQAVRKRGLWVLDVPELSGNVTTAFSKHLKAANPSPGTVKVYFFVLT